MTTDPHGIISDVNQQMMSLTGCTRDELIGAPCEAFFTDPARADAAIKRVLAENKVRDYELTVRARNAEETVVSYNAASFYDRDRNLQGVFAAARDVTERKRFERELQEKNLEMARANAATDTFLATMSHEVRTPLSGLLGMLELLGMSTLDREQRETLEVARDSGRGLVRIIDDVLDHSRIEAGKLELFLEPVSMAHMVRRVLNAYRGVANVKELALRQTVDARLSPLSPSLMADPLRLSQILNNLVSNALKFTNEGSVEVRAELLERTAEADTVRLSVKDTGIGMSPEVQRRLFQPFEQAAAVTAHLYGGSGLGLSISRRLAAMMGGSIVVTTAPGEGTTMSVTLALPISDAEPAELAGAAMVPIAPIRETDAYAAGPVILAVDDHPVNRTLLVRQIMALGLRVRTAANGVAALALWEAGGIALIVTDCNMPQMDGYALARAVRQVEADQSLPRTPIIAWTANVLPDAAALCRAAGMDDVLHKPAALAVLKGTLSRWLPSAAMPTTVDQSRPLVDLPSVPTAVRAPEDMEKISLDATERAAILLDFMTQTRSDLANLCDALILNNLPACARTGHRMKGSSRMVGARDLALACENLEHGATNGDSQQAEAAKATMDLALERLETHITDTTLAN